MSYHLDVLIMMKQTYMLLLVIARWLPMKHTNALESQPLSIGNTRTYVAIAQVGYSWYVTKGQVEGNDSRVLFRSTAKPLVIRTRIGRLTI